MRLLRRLRRLLQSDTLGEEMEAHLAFRAAELEERGLPRREAALMARREFGNVLRTSEESREIWIARWASDLAQDLRFGLRTLAKARGFTAVSILSAALGIGACSTIFGIANFLLLRGLPVAEPERLLSLNGRTGRNDVGDSLSYPEVLDVGASKSFAGVAGVYLLTTGSFTMGSESHRHWGSLVTANFFDVARPAFALGRGFHPARDDTPGASSIVLSYRLWQSRFGGDPAIVGRTIRWNNRPVTVTGVTAAGFRGTELLLVTEFWVPFGMAADVPSLQSEGNRRFHSRGNSWLMGVARLAPGKTIRDARAELEVLAANLQQQYPEQKDRAFHLQPAGQINAGAKDLLFLFFGLLAIVTVLVLLVASANVANLLLARAASRRREVATRLAIGAGRGRLVRQLLAESVLLAGAGGLLGCALAAVAAASLGRIQLPFPVPLDFTVLVDYRILVFSLLLSVATGILFGLAPALRATRLDLAAALKEEISNTGRPARGFSLRNALVVSQVALSMLLLICSGLFLRSLYTASNVPLGMRSRDILILAVDPTLNRYPMEKAEQFFRTALDRVRALPGVEDATFTQTVPLSIGASNSRVSTPDGKKTLQSTVFVVAPRYFETLGIGLPEGVDFRGDNSDHGAAILNQTAARRLFAGENPVGRIIRVRERNVRVIGVAGDSKLRTIGEDPRACIYLPLSEYYGREDSMMGFSLMARTRGPAAAMLDAARDQIRALDPALAVFDMRTIETHLERALLPPRLGAVMFGLCGVIALLISTIGLYGVISFTVARRTKEIGIRMALGAERGKVVALILKDGMTLSLIGIALGVGLALAVSRVASSLLYGVSATDAITFTGVPLFLLMIALAAAWIPARRAASVDPVGTLRHD
ncbi:MAG: ABC transporter permease [Bryobacteraceae bacterium]|nr:ABC transporter permease [Bryobacteraceae bacterium]